MVVIKTIYIDVIYCKCSTMNENYSIVANIVIRTNYVSHCFFEKKRCLSYIVSCNVKKKIP